MQTGDKPPRRDLDRARCASGARDVAKGTAAASRESRPWARRIVTLLVLAVPVLAAESPTELEKRLERATGAEQVEVLLKLAETHMYRAPDKVVAYSQRALDAASALKEPLGQARALLSRATGYFQLGDLDRALGSYQAGLEAAQGLGDDVVLGGCLNGIAAVNMKRGQLDSALASFSAAITHLERANNRERLAGVYNNVSLIYYTKGEYNRALDYMFKALRLYEGLGDDNGQGVVLNAIGNVHSRLGNPDEARAHFERALALAEKTGHKQLMVGCLVNIGEIHGKRQEWDQALAYLDRALPIARALGSRDYIYVCLNNIGDVLREKGETKRALDYYLESLQLSEAMNAKPRLAVSYINIGRLYFKTGQVAAAESFLLKAFDLAREAEERGLQKDAAEVLTAIYEAKGDFRRALEFQRANTSLKEQIFSKENYEKITTLQASYEADKRQREIQLLRKEGKIKELEVKRQKLWLAVVATGLILVAVVAAVLLRRYRLKVRTSAELTAAYARMEELAKLDELTALYNRRSATERIEIEMARTGRTSRPFAIVMVDVDDFKAINDERGHESGDEVLRRLAELLRRHVRSQDVVARWGGDEFLLILPETSREGAMVLAEKLRRSVAAEAEGGGCDVRFTVTLGISVYDKLGAASESIRGADEALLEGKRAGKNRAVLAAA